MIKSFVRISRSGESFARRFGIDGQFGRKLVGDVKHAAAIGADDQLIAGMEAIVDVGDEGHVAGVADIFFAAAIGLAEGGEGFAFVAVGEAFEGVAGFGWDGFGGLVANGAKLIDFGLELGEFSAELLFSFFVGYFFGLDL